MAKILLVEDDKALREIYGVRLLAEGYDIVSASDGEEAIVMAKKEQPDLILSDVMMPRVSGFDMLDILKSTAETANIKVIIMTALSSDEQRERGEALGADLYLVKSQVGIEDVVRSVKEVLDGKSPSVEENNLFSTPDVSDAWGQKTDSAETETTQSDPATIPEEPVIETAPTPTEDTATEQTMNTESIVDDAPTPESVTPTPPIEPAAIDTPIATVQQPVIQTEPTAGSTEAQPESITEASEETSDAEPVAPTGRDTFDYSRPDTRYQSDRPELEIAPPARPTTTPNDVSDQLSQALAETEDNSESA